MCIVSRLLLEENTDIEVVLFNHCRSMHVGDGCELIDLNLLIIFSVHCNRFCRSKRYNSIKNTYFEIKMLTVGKSHPAFPENEDLSALNLLVTDSKCSTNTC